MRQSLAARPAAAAATAQPNWLQLPILCCQAAGGDAQQAEAAAAAWALLYAAAHVLDSVQDGDPPDAWWEPLGPGPASNAATGLIASCALLLVPGPDQAPKDAAGECQLPDFFETVLLMGSGQHLDLTAAFPTLEACWRIAEAKSGAFFGLACRAGARAAGIDELLVTHYSRYGVCLGLLLQIGDDLSDLAAAGTNDPAPSGHDRMALPLAYFMSVAPADAVQRLEVARSNIAKSLAPTPGLAELLYGAGAGLYLKAKVHELRERGAQALSQAQAASPALEPLLALLESTPPAV